MSQHKIMVIVIVMVGVLVATGSYFWYAFTRVPSGKSEIQIGDEVFKADIADTEMLRMKGLMGRTDLGDHEGMLFVFSSPNDYGFWMKGMKMSIDIIWIQDNRVIGFEENLEPDASFMPTIYHPSGSVNRVLEVKAGTVARQSIKVGDSVIIY